MAKSREITSSKNPVVRRFRDAGVGKVPGVMLAEGVRLVAEALAEGIEVVEAAVSPRLRDDGLRRRLEQSAPTLFECSDAVLERISRLDAPQGVAVLLRRPEHPEERLLHGDLAPLVVVAAGVRDPGNLGSIARASEAAGASGLLTMEGGADPFRDKALRGSMGSLFRLPVRHGLDARGIIAFARRHRLQLVVADGGGGTLHIEADLRKPTALVVGAEAVGVEDDLCRAADVRVRIPLCGRVESLNVAVATGVLLFEAQRQRAL